MHPPVQSVLYVVHSTIFSCVVDVMRLGIVAENTRKVTGKLTRLGAKEAKWQQKKS